MGEGVSRVREFVAYPIMIIGVAFMYFAFLVAGDDLR